MPLSSGSAVAVCSISVVLATSGVAHAEEDPASPRSVAEERAPEPATARGIAPSSFASNAGGPPAPRRARHAAKRFVVARDFGLSVPVGQLAEEAATMYGPLVRLGFHVTDSFEVGIRAGYQRGFNKTVDGTASSLSSVPINAGVRWFVLGDRSGPYAGAELGANVFRQKHGPRTSFFDVSADSTWVRPSANFGAGFVWSRSQPVDIRVHLACLDLLAKGGPQNTLAIGIAAGYSIFF